MRITRIPTRSATTGAAMAAALALASCVDSGGGAPMLATAGTTGLAPGVSAAPAAASAADIQLRNLVAAHSMHGKTSPASRSAPTTPTMARRCA